MTNPMHASERPVILPRAYPNREWFTAHRIADTREPHRITTGDPWFTYPGPVPAF